MAVGTSTETTIRRVRRTLDDAGASLLGRRVLALCSGGSDSVALVALLGALPRGAAPAAIDVLWVDHGVRGDTAAERDAAAAAAASVGAPFHERRVREIEASPGVGSEAEFRARRYELAAALAGELGADTTCTGHSASDQLEQALLSLVGVTGRGGAVDAMPVSRELAPGVQLVRPLLGCTRDELEAACRHAGLGWAVDPTNDDPEYAARNAVRHRVVPALLDVRADAGVALARAGRRERERADTTAALARAVLGGMVGDDPRRIDVRALARWDAPVRRELVAAWLRDAALGRALSERVVVAVERLASLPGRAACSRVDLGRGACVVRDGYDLSITAAPDSEGPSQ